MKTQNNDEVPEQFINPGILSCFENNTFSWLEDVG